MIAIEAFTRLASIAAELIVRIVWAGGSHWLFVCVGANLFADCARLLGITYLPRQVLAKEVF